MNPKNKRVRDELFEEFWTHTVRKVGKGYARRAFNTAVEDGVDAFFLIERWRLSNVRWATWPKAERKYIPYPENWLRGERWEDEELPHYGEGADLDMFAAMPEEQAMAFFFGPPAQGAPTYHLTDGFATSPVTDGRDINDLDGGSPNTGREP